jgi:hypothetical protein
MTALIVQLPVKLDLTPLDFFKGNFEGHCVPGCSNNTETHVATYYWRICCFESASNWTIEAVYFIEFQVLIAVTVKSTFLGCHAVLSSRKFTTVSEELLASCLLGLLFVLAGVGSNAYFQNICEILSDCMVSHHRRQYSSPKIFCLFFFSDFLVSRLLC